MGDILLEKEGEDKVLASQGFSSCCVYVEKNKIYKKQSERMLLRRGLETWKGSASERKEGIPGRRIYWSKDTKVGTCLPHGGKNADQKIK